MKFRLTSLIVFAAVYCFGQYPQYRITNEGEYQYLANNGLPGMVLDETKGTTYNPITVRTFFLEIQQKGYLPAGTTYEDFFSASIEEQRNMINQPFAKPLDCSVGLPVSQGCLVYKANTSQYFANRSSSVRRIPISRGPRERIETVKLILREE